MDAPAGAVDYQSPKIADNACGVVSLPAKTMADIPPLAGTLYLVSPQGGMPKVSGGKAAKNFAIFQDFGAKTGGAGRKRKVRPAFPRGKMRGQICRQDARGDLFRGSLRKRNRDSTTTACPRPFGNGEWALLARYLCHAKTISEKPCRCWL